MYRFLLIFKQKRLSEQKYEFRIAANDTLLETRPILVPLKWTNERTNIRYMLQINQDSFFSVGPCTEVRLMRNPAQKKTENNYLWSMSLFFIVGTRSEWINIKGIYVEMKIEPEKLATNWDRWLQCKRVEEIRIIFYQLVWQCVTLTLKLCVKCETASYLLNMCDSVIAANEQKKSICVYIVLIHLSSVQIVITSTLTAQSLNTWIFFLHITKTTLGKKF